MKKNGLGIIFPLEGILSGDVEELFSFGLDCVQIRAWHPENLTEENAEKVRKVLDGKLYVSSVWAGYSGPCRFDFVSGLSTIGIVPEAYRAMRLKELCRGVDFARMLSAPDVATHMGYIPELPVYEAYRGVVEAVKFVGSYAAARDIHFNFETGQETPVTLMRTIQDTGLSNLGVNLDPANLVMYGRGNPLDAADIFASRVRGVHVKDGFYPEGDFHQLGREVKVGEGKVNFPALVEKLKKNGYEGDFYIEREISGDQQIADIRDTVAYMRKLLK